MLTTYSDYDFLIFCTLKPFTLFSFYTVTYVCSRRLNSESWPRAGNPGSDLCKTDFTETSILAPRLVC